MLQCPSQINVFICFENKNIGVLHSTFYFKSFPISYHNVGGGESLLKSPAWEQALSHVLQFSEHNKLFNNAF